MESGFIIRCLKCGEEFQVTPRRRRNYRNEPIVFGTDNYGSDQISCECGNAIEEHSRYEGDPYEGEFIVEWRDLSNRSS